MHVPLYGHVEFAGGRRVVFVLHRHSTEKLSSFKLVWSCLRDRVLVYSERESERIVKHYLHLRSIYTEPK